jgi:hypothetical protein
MPVIKEILEAPVHILVLPPILEESIHQSQVITLLTHKFGMCVTGLALLVLGPEEDVGRVEAGNDSHDFIHAVVLGGAEQDFRELWLEGELGHAFSLGSQVSIII